MSGLKIIVICYLGKMIKILILLFIVGVLLAIWAFGFEPNMLKVTTYRVAKPELSGLKIAFASDFHIAPRHKKRLEKIVKKINEQKADLILLGGDFVKGHKFETSMPIEEIAQELSKLDAPLGVVSVLGNHDWWQNGQKIKEVLQDSGIVVLENENQKLIYNGRLLLLAGLADYNTRKVDIDKALSETENNVLLLTHSPDVFPEIPQKVFLTLAGHTHGGQVTLPWWGALLVPSKYGKKYEGGFIEENGKKMIVGRGLGTSLLPVRLGCMPEIVVVEFY